MMKVKDTLSRCCAIAAVGFAVCATSCTSPRSAQVALTFASWDDSVAFLQKRHLIPDDESHREQCKRDSVTNDVQISGRTFRTVMLDYRGESRFGIRGQNGPIYVFLRSGDQYALVGGFLGSRIDVVHERGDTIAKVYTHVSAWETPVDSYPFQAGVFNVIDPNARGDVFK